jgi:hypothetical protein
MAKRHKGCFCIQCIDTSTLHQGPQPGVAQ